MNTEHTPGPWRVDYAQGIIAANGTAVAYVEADHSDTPSPDARLIAAAPDLLEALNDMLSLLGNAGTEDAKTWQPMQNWIFEEDKVSAKNRITSARAAIAKAEGKA